jgi:hypothetical protein
MREHERDDVGVGEANGQHRRCRRGAAIMGVVAVWAVGLRFAWRAHLFERFLGLDLRLPASP